MQELEEPSERDRFQSTIPTQLSVIWNTLQAGDEGAAQEALELFIEVAESHPRFLKRNLAEIANAMLQVGAAVLLASTYVKERKVEMCLFGLALSARPSAALAL